MAPDGSDALRAIQLATDRGFQSELAALRAKATLKELLGAAPDYRWAYTAERAVRNATALHLALRRLSADGESTPASERAALVTAQAWEGIAALEERAHRATALMNAAVEYELAGYQANAACLARLSASTQSWTSELTYEGLAAAFVQRLMLRVVQGSLELLSPAEVDRTTEDELLGRMAAALGARALATAAYFFLSGDQGRISAALDELSLAAESFGALGDVRRHNLTMNIRSLLPTMRSRSTWTSLSDVVPGNLRWQRYLRVLARGLSRSVLDGRSVSELWPSQLAAIRGGILDDRASKVVKMPTSAGKTRVAELAIVHTLVTKPDARCLYVAPFRALVSEVEDSFSNLFADLGYAASSVLGAYEDDVLDRLVLAEDQVLVVTPEKLDLIVRLAPEVLAGVALIVLDEGHIVGDAGRGARYELLITRLRRRLPDARVLFLSAVVPQETLDDFAAWLGTDAEADVVVSDWRPSIQRLAKLEWSGTVGRLQYAAEGDDEVLGRYLPNLIRQRRFEYVHLATGRVRRPVFPEAANKGHVAAALAFELAAQGPVLVFCAQTDWAQSVGNAVETRVDLAARTGEALPSTFRPIDHPRSFLVAQEWLGDNDPTTRLLAMGVGVHHGRQPEAVRNAIEEDFRNRRLAVLCATTTLAQGVNLPVRTVVIHSCWRYDEESDARTRLSAREYWNIAGRAGRAGEETEGTIIHIVSTPQDQADFEYFRRSRNQVEPVRSSLFKLLDDLVQARITPAALAGRLDAELLALLVEEAVGGLDETVLGEIVRDSLVGVQARRHRAFTAPLVSAMASGVRSIASMVPDQEDRRIFSSTGLRTASCRAIDAHIGLHGQRLQSWLSDGDYSHRDALLALILEALTAVDEMQPRSAYGGSYPDLLSHWLEGRPLAQMPAGGAKLADDVSRFVEEYFSYLLPWGMSAYMRIATYRLGVESVSAIIAGLPSMVKYGVPTLEAAWAMAAGAANRSTAMLLADLYVASTDEPSAHGMRRWLTELTPEELVEDYGLPEAALAEVNRALFRSRQSAVLAELDRGRPLLPMTVRVRLLRRSVYRGQLGSDVAVELRRDYDSAYRNAVAVYFDGRVLGYLGREDAQALALELDAGVRVVAVVGSLTEDDGGRPLALVDVAEVVDA